MLFFVIKDELKQCVGCNAQKWAWRFESTYLYFQNGEGAEGRVG